MRLHLIGLMENNDFQYILSYMYSQDLLELLFAYISGKNVFNNNPNLRLENSSRLEISSIRLKTVKGVHRVFF